MPLWAAAGIGFFVYVALVAVLRRGLSSRRRRAAGLAACAGAALAWWGGSVTSFWLRDLVLPPLVLLAAYRASGLLWTAPMPGLERWLLSVDRALGVDRLAPRLPRPVCEFLEIAYAGVYALIPAALLLHLAFSPAPSAERFWTVILLTDFVCFGMLPWLQTRPPRTLASDPPWRSRVRRFNLRLLGHASIQANTLPSGHAAEALAACLLVADAPLPVAAFMALCAVAVTLGAVLGRYHYAVDALTGWAAAVAIQNLEFRI